MPRCMYCKSELIDGKQKVTHYCFFCKNELNEHDQKLSYCPYCYPKLSQAIVQAGEESGLDMTGSNTGEVLDKIFDYLQGESPVQSKSVHFPGFEVKGELGRGGMGSVLLAREFSAKRDIALKTFSPITTLIDIKQYEERFLEEALITAQLQHPGIVPIYTISHDSEGKIFYTMRPVEGESLRLILMRLKKDDRHTAQQYPLKKLMNIMATVCETVRFAHERGVIHRDLKPGNIIVGNYGEVQVIDWGLAKVIGNAKVENKRPAHPEQSFSDIEEQNGDLSNVWQLYQRDLETRRTEDFSEDFQLTHDGQIMGTPSYMSPEQVRGEIDEINFLSDIWALGVILFECATLFLPFFAESTDRVLYNILKEDPVNPVDVNPHRRVPSELAAIILKCLQKHKKDRYSSIGEILIDLHSWIEGIAPWRVVEEFNFSKMSDGKPDGLHISQGNWEIKEGELHGPDYGALLTKEEYYGDVRVELEAFVLPGNTGEISMILSAPDPEKSQFVHDGYVMRMRADKNKTTTAINKGHVSILGRDYDLSLSSSQTIVAERVGTIVRLMCNNDNLVHYRDFFPLSGNRIGLFSMGSGVRIKSFRILSRGSNLVIPCLDYANSYLDRGMFEEAKDYYRRIYTDHEEREEGVEALFRYGLLCLQQADSLDPEKDKATYNELFKTALEHFDKVEKTFFAPLGVLGKAMAYDQNGESDKVIDELLRAYDQYADYDTLPVISERVRVRRHVRSSEGVVTPSAKLREGIERVLFSFDTCPSHSMPLKGLPVDSLDLSDNVANISGLRGLELQILNLTQTHVEDLEPLRGMPLKALSLPKTVADINPLKDLPLEALDLSMSSVHDISVIKELTLQYLALSEGVTDLSSLETQFLLEHLDLSLTGVKDIHSISDLPLKVLRLPLELVSIPLLKSSSLDFLVIPKNVTDLNGLRGLNLRGIDLSSAQITDISPLEGMALEYIALSPGTADINPLRDMPVRSLNLFSTSVTDLSVLTTLPHLEYLSIYPSGLEGNWQEIVKHLPDLKCLTSDAVMSPCSPSEFWRLFDAGNLNGSRSDLSNLSRDRCEITSKTGLKLRWIPPGVFLMGSPLHESGRHPTEHQHFVCLCHGHYMATTPVRVRDFRAFVNSTGYVTEAEKEGCSYGLKENKWGRFEGLSWRNPGFSQDPSHPVVCVTWNDAMAFCEWLKKTEELSFRLPTESEWEYSCRAGSVGSYYGNLNQVCWHFRNSNMSTHPVGQKSANNFGLFDMHGNVFEWCLDYYANYPLGFSVDPKGPDEGHNRVYRGGSWYGFPFVCRSANRFNDPPSCSNANVGFRIIADY